MMTKIQACICITMSHFIPYSWIWANEDFINVYVSQPKKLALEIPCVKHLKRQFCV
jgi:hypothetical protein